MTGASSQIQTKHTRGQAGHWQRLGALGLVLALTATSLAIVSKPQTAAAQPARTAPSVMDCWEFRPVLYQGVNGQSGCIAALQWFLNRWKHRSLLSDGIFGPRTGWAVLDFQVTNNITADAVVGNVTWSHIHAQCMEWQSLGAPWCHQRMSY